MNTSKHACLLFTAVLVAAAASACPACEQQQPRLLRGITHGAGPQGGFDYVVVAIAVVIVIATLYYSLKWLIFPGEQSPGHIKRFILNEE